MAVSGLAPNDGCERACTERSLRAWGWFSSRNPTYIQEKLPHFLRLKMGEQYQFLSVLSAPASGMVTLRLF
jgi:hypothetical protein